MSLTFDTAVGARIKAGRERLNLTQADLAHRTGVRPETIRDWESCSGYPSTSFHHAMADALGCTVEWLLDGVGDPPGEPRPVLPRLEVQASTTEAEQPQWFHNCDDCGAGMSEHGVCHVDGVDVCFFCAKKRGHLVTVGAQNAEQPLPPARGKRATRKAPKMMTVLSETVGPEIQHSFLGEPTQAATQMTATPPEVRIPAVAPEAVSAAPTTIEQLVAERFRLEMAIDSLEAEKKAVDAQILPLLSPEKPSIEIRGYKLTLVISGPSVSVSWDVDRMLKERPALIHVLQAYRSEKVKTKAPYLRGTVTREGGQS